MFAVAGTRSLKGGGRASPYHILHPALGLWMSQQKLTCDPEAENHTLWTAEQASWRARLREARRHHTALKCLPPGFDIKGKETSVLFKLLLFGVFYMQQINPPSCKTQKK